MKQLLNLHTRLIKLVTIVCVLLASGCAVIHFENGEVAPDPNADKFFYGWFGEDESTVDPGSSIRFNKWYHHSFYQIAEINNPLDLSRECPGLEWNQITTNTNPFKVVIGLLDNAILIPAASAGIDLWSPWGIEYSCRYQ